ncbi:glycosyltransferase family 2 protein [Rhodosalinus sp. FB01]|uniref:glycosyltransferase family 2 protein n=1 Tax=Rhodosalinus sp. FB01 TaxID=3239194 RepID=UPI0035247A0E
MKPTISVIIPTYNRGHCVGDAIESVLSQDPPADEVIVVDDGSTDTTPEVLTCYSKQVTIIYQNNAGAAAARNTGIRHANSTWVAFLDSDDLWWPGRMAVLHRDLANADESIVGHSGDIRFTGPHQEMGLFDLRGWEFPRGKAVRITDILLEEMTGLFSIATALRRSIVLEEGGYRENLRIYEDVALFYALALRGSWLFTGDVLAEARRLENDTDPLTAIEKKYPIEAASGRVQLTSALLTKDLSLKQRKIMMKQTSGALLILAAAEAAEKSGSHRRTAIASARQHPSALKGWLKALPPLLFGRAGYGLITRQRNGFSRS